MPHSLNLTDRQSPRGGLTIDTLRASPQSGFSYAHSPSGTSTPTSYVYSNTPSSPYGSTLGSPISISRNPGPWQDRALGRRLSVPSGSNPFQTGSAGIQSPPYMNPLVPSNVSHYPNNGSSVASPTGSSYSFAKSDAGAEADWRRRTWHPTTLSNYQRPATSGLSYSQTPDAPRPAFAPQALAAAGQTPRLPGIETFDQIPPRSGTSPRQGEAQLVDASMRPVLHSSSSDRSVPNAIERRGHTSWDMSLHQNLTKLEIASGTPPKEPGQWGTQAIPEIQQAVPLGSSGFGNQAQQPKQTSETALRPALLDRHKGSGELDLFSQFPQPPSQTPIKRQGWYNGPAAIPQHVVPPQRSSPAESSSSEGIRTPATAAIDFQPTVLQLNGCTENQGLGHTASFAVSIFPTGLCCLTDTGRKCPSRASTTLSRPLRQVWYRRRHCSNNHNRSYRSPILVA